MEIHITRCKNQSSTFFFIRFNWLNLAWTHYPFTVMKGKVIKILQLRGDVMIPTLAANNY